MLEPLPYRQPDRLVSVWETNRGGTTRNGINIANFMAWQERSRTLEHLSMVGPRTVAMVLNGQADEISGFNMSFDAFRALGVQPSLGRAYTAEEDLQDVATSVIVLGHEFWQTRLGGRSDVLEMTLTTDGQRRSVIGVMPPGFSVNGQKTDFLLPYNMTPQQMRAARGRGPTYAIGRLRDGVSFDQAYGEMRRIYAELEKEEPQRNAARTVMVFSLQELMVGEVRPALLVLVGAVLLVLLVACVNVANLLLARTAAREREVGVRTALGAGRARLMRQLLAESLVLAAAGCIAGLGVATLCLRGLLALVGDRIFIPRLEQATLDLPVVAFTVVVALATGILFGVVPALVSTGGATDALREGSRQVGGRRLHRALSTLVVAEVALSLVLLSGAGLLLRSFVKLQNIDLGYRAEGVLTAGVALPGVQYNAAKSTDFFRDALLRVAALPGVRNVAGASCMPPPGSCIGTSTWRADQPKPADGQLRSSQIRPITPAFFRTMEVPFLTGRDFAESDTATSVPVAIVSDTFVREQFAGENPLDRHLRINITHANGKDDVEWVVIGVVRDVRSSLNGAAAPTIYVPTTQLPGRSMRFFVRTEQDPMSVATGVTGVVRAMEPAAPVDIRTLDEVVGSTIARPRAIAVLVGAFALVALALAAVGVYGVMAYAVRERTQEIGVRMALGATASSVFGLVLGRALRLVSIGVVVGLVAAGVLTRLMEQLLYEVAPLDPWTFAITTVVLLVVAAVASCVPARRGMRMAPVDALRTN
jgi:putative ABC transport system permease protein